MGGMTHPIGIHCVGHVDGDIMFTIRMSYYVPGVMTSEQVDPTSAITSEKLHRLNPKLMLLRSDSQLTLITFDC